jgi:hypothetical protein
MAKVDLEKYKAAWQHEAVFEEDKLSQKQVAGFLRAASKDTLTLFKRSLIFDIVLKAILLTLFIPLIFWMPYSGSWMGIVLLLVLIHAGGIAWQVRTIRKIPQVDRGGQPVLDVLRSYIAYYYQHYYASIFVAAISSSLLFLVGSLHYFYFKYGEVPAPAIDDLLVLGTGLLLSFALSVVAQLWQNNFRMRQLETRVEEIEADTLTERSMEQYRSRRARNIILISIALLAGVLLLVYFIYQFID